MYNHKRVQWVLVSWEHHSIKAINKQLNFKMHSWRATGGLDLFPLPPPPPSSCLHGRCTDQRCCESSDPVSLKHWQTWERLRLQSAERNNCLWVSCTMMKLPYICHSINKAVSESVYCKGWMYVLLNKSPTLMCLAITTTTKGINIYTQCQFTKSAKRKTWLCFFALI